MNEASEQQGPAVVTTPRKPPEVREQFRKLMADLRQWREDDHADNITLPRNHVIELIEGVGALVSALEPFTRYATNVEASDAVRAQHAKDEGRTFRPRSDSETVFIALGDCRRARRAAGE